MKKASTKFLLFVAVLIVFVVISLAYVLLGKKWPVGTVITYYVNANTAQVADEEDAVKSAAGTWSQVYPSGLRLSYGGSSGETTYSYNGLYTVCWADEGASGTLATAWIWSIGSTIVETDMVFNDYYSWSSSGSHNDVETVALHEFGHWVGLDHSSTGIMRSVYSGIQRSIDSDARAGFEAMYGSESVYSLALTSGVGGTTSPAPGNYTCDEWTQVNITAIPDSGYRFSGWSGDASGTANPITITMNSDKSITASFIRLYKLNLASEEHGTTDPAPGEHIYDEGTEVNVTAIPDTHYRFNGWSGDVPSGKENENPISITMNSDKSLTASFIRIIYPPLNFTGEKVLNYSLSQDEYINVLTWEANPDNENIEKYRIYQMEGESRSLLIELDAGTFKYWHRNVEKEKLYNYALIAVNSENREGDAAYVSIK